MRTIREQWPDNVEVFRIGRWRADHFDQEMMRTMRKIADNRGSTIEEVMDRALVDFGKRCVADSKLETKVIPFPIKRRRSPNSSSGYRHWTHVMPPHKLTGGDESIPKGSLWKANVFVLLGQSRALRESLCFNAEKLAALISDSQRSRLELRRAVAQCQEARSRRLSSELRTRASISRKRSHLFIRTHTETLPQPRGAPAIQIFRRLRSTR